MPRLVFLRPLGLRLDSDLGSDQWNVIRDAARALPATPAAFNQGCISKLRGVGFSDLQIVDLINSVAFFNWANRLMLSLGEPEVPRRIVAMSFCEPRSWL